MWLDLLTMVIELNCLATIYYNYLKAKPCFCIPFEVKKGTKPTNVKFALIFFA